MKTLECVIKLAFGIVYQNDSFKLSKYHNKCLAEIIE